MATKPVFQYHPITKEFVTQGLAYESPLEEGVFHIPANSTEIEPPAPQNGKVIVFVNDEWQLIDDNRGIWYSPDRESHEVFNFNDVIPNNWTRTQPQKTLNELKVDKNAKINQWRAIANNSTFTHEGKTFSCDSLSRSDIDAINGRVATRNSLPANWVGGWKAVDNTVLEITTVAQWNDFYDAMVSQGTANFAHAQELKAALLSATTKAQVEAIVW